MIKFTVTESIDDFKKFFHPKLLEKQLQKRFSHVSVSTWTGITDLGFRFRAVDFSPAKDINISISESLYFLCGRHTEKGCIEPILNIHQNVKIGYKNATREIEILVQYNEQRKELTIITFPQRGLKSFLKIWGPSIHNRD